MTTENECPFCQIVAGDDPDARVVYRGTYVIAFFPTEPAVLGHTLVVPTRHVPDLWALDDPLTVELALATRRIAEVIRDRLRPDGINIIQSNGAAATQTVPHLHIHIVPRRFGDNFGPIWPPETDYAELVKDAAWVELRQALGRLTDS